jgi:hypothetical protein
VGSTPGHPMKIGLILWAFDAIKLLGGHLVATPRHDLPDLARTRRRAIASTARSCAPGMTWAYVLSVVTGML